MSSHTTYFHLRSVSAMWYIVHLCCPPDAFAHTAIAAQCLELILAVSQLWPSQCRRKYQAHMEVWAPVKHGSVDRRLTYACAQSMACGILFQPDSCTRSAIYLSNWVGWTKNNDKRLCWSSKPGQKVPKESPLEIVESKSTYFDLYPVFNHLRDSFAPFGRIRVYRGFNFVNVIIKLN